MATTAENHTTLTEAAATEIQTHDAAVAASIAATSAAGLPGLAVHHRTALVASLRAGSTWAEATAALAAGQNPALVPGAETLAAWRETLTLEAAE